MAWERSLEVIKNGEKATRPGECDNRRTINGFERAVWRAALPLLGQLRGVADLSASGIMSMSIAKMCIRIKLNLITIPAGLLAALVLFFDVASASNGYGGASGPPPDRRGQGYYRADPGHGNYRSGPGLGNYQGNRGPGFYRGQPYSPYGGPQRGGYGERRAVQSKGDAQRMLNDYYMRRNVRIGPIRESRFYFEADILDKNNRFMDRVIIDKRSGRIRSVY